MNEDFRLAVRSHLNGIIDKPSPSFSNYELSFQQSLWREIEIFWFRKRNHYGCISPSEFCYWVNHFSYVIITQWVEEHYLEIVQELIDSSKPGSIGEYWFNQRVNGVQWWIELF